MQEDMRGCFREDSVYIFLLQMSEAAAQSAKIVKTGYKQLQQYKE